MMSHAKLHGVRIERCMVGWLDAQAWTVATDQIGQNAPKRVKGVIRP